MSDSKSSGANPLQLVSSSRLLALRANSEAAQAQSSTATSKFTKPSPDQGEDAETARLRRLIEQHLQRIMETMPSGKQQSLFKIRFGMSLDEIKALPPQKAAKQLKIKL